MEAHEAAIAAHLVHQEMAVVVAAGATQDEAIAAGHETMEAATGADRSAHILD